MFLNYRPARSGQSFRLLQPMSDDEDPGVWMPKDIADKYDDDILGRWFLNLYLIDYGNSFEYTASREDEMEMIFRRTSK